MTRTWSTYQQAIFSAVADPQAGSLIVQAVAGSGKTTTIVEAMSRLPAGKASLFLAFNKSIAESLKARGVNARTYHSLCFTPVLRSCGQAKVEGNKLRTLVREWPRDLARDYGTAACKLVGLARNAGIGCLLPDTDAEWLAIAERHDVTPDTDAGNESGMVAAARRLMVECDASPLCDFDDLLYRAVARNIPLPRYDVVFVDESQDSNAINIALLRKVLAVGGRLVAVGDRAQAIYSFRGAFSDSMDRIAAEFDCRELPLSISYRCARSVVKLAAQFAPIVPADTAPEGAVISRGSWVPSDFSAGDLVMCRTNAPLIKLAYRMIRERLPFQMMGRDIGAGLVTLINKLQPKGIDGLTDKLAAWEDREVAKAKARDNDALAASISDKCESIRAVIESLPENNRTVPELCRTIESLFNGTSGAVLCTVHKAKGLEADRAWILNYSKMPAKWAKKDWEKQAETNLLYVAITRAKETLCLIEERCDD